MFGRVQILKRPIDLTAEKKPARKVTSAEVKDSKTAQKLFSKLQNDPKLKTKIKHISLMILVSEKLKKEFSFIEEFILLGKNHEQRDDHFYRIAIHACGAKKEFEAAKILLNHALSVKKANCKVLSSMVYAAVKCEEFSYLDTLPKLIGQKDQDLLAQVIKAQSITNPKEKNKVLEELRREQSYFNKGLHKFKTQMVIAEQKKQKFISKPKSTIEGVEFLSNVVNVRKDERKATPPATAPQKAAAASNAFSSIWSPSVSSDSAWEIPKAAESGSKTGLGNS